MSSSGIPGRYIADLTDRPKFSRRAQGGRRLRQWHGRGVRAQVLAALGAEVVPLDAELDYTFPALQSEPRRHPDAARHGRRGARERGRHRPRLRRRRRSLRRGRQQGRGDFRRQDRGDAGARPVGPPQGRDLRRRRQVDRTVRDRSRASRPGVNADYLEDRPFLHQAAGQRAQRARRLREVRPLFLQ